MEKSKLRQVIVDSMEFFHEKKDLIKRDIDLQKYLRTKQIVVISGVRRCGKSSLLHLIKDAQKDIKNDYSILYLNFDDERLAAMQPEDFNTIYSIFLEDFCHDKRNVCFFFDEIQNAQGWEKFLNRMQEQSIKIYVTGSNAALLSSEIATSLTGRNTVLDLYPFSFGEYLQLNKEEYASVSSLSTAKKASLKNHFKNYFNYGSFPLVIKEKDKGILKDYYNDIFYRDIIVRHSVTKVREMKLIGSFLASNIGKIYSYNTLRNISGLNSLSTIKNYLDYFKDAFIFFSLDKFSYSLKTQINTSKKIYCIDHALAREIGFGFSENYGRFLENLVFIELKRRKKEIYYYADTYECDFLVKEKNKITQVIQVTRELVEENKKRELEGLLAAVKQYKLNSGLILTEDQEDVIEIDGKTVILKPVWQWLLE